MGVGNFTHRPLCSRERTLVATAYEAGSDPHLDWIFQGNKTLSLSLSLSIYIYIYLFIYLFIYMCVLFPVLHITIGKTSWSKTIRKIITSYFFRNRKIHGPPLYIEISVLNLQLFIFKTNTTYIYNCALEGKNNGL